MSWNRLLKKSKYGAVRVKSSDGRSFASKGERSCHAWLQLMEKAGEIEILQTQCSVYLSAAKILFKPDFKIRNLHTGVETWVEFKGFETTEYRIKRRLWIAYGPGPLWVVKGSGTRMVIHEILQGGGAE